MKKYRRPKRLLSGMMMFGLALAWLLSTHGATTSAASCTPPATTYGTDTMSVNIPLSGTYRIWTRLQAPSTTSNEILLNIDNSTCYDVGGSASIPLNTWTWLDYSDGSAANVISASLTAGTHTFTLIGIEGGVLVDRIEALSDTTCTPSGTGDNCTPATPVDTTPPSVSISSKPSAVTGLNSASFNFSGTDDTTSAANLTYQCSLDSAAYASCASPKAYSGLAAGSHSFGVKATDQAGNVSTAATYSWTVDTTPPTVSITAPTLGATISGTVSVAAAATDNVAVANVQFKLDGQNLGTADTTSPYSYSWNTTASTNGSHVISVLATDSAGNVSSDNITLTVNNVASGGDTTAPGVPAGLKVNTAIPTTATTISLAWNAASDNSGGSGLGGYKLYRNGSLIATLGSATTSYTDINLTVGTSYNYSVAAYDNAGNTSSQSVALGLSSNPLVGDLDGDSHVTGHDLSVLLAHYNTVYPQGQFDGFSLVEGHDVSLLLSNYGK